jgi:3-isopropylmalate/(R)-2-methylmalate dehydratase small subunit
MDEFTRLEAVACPLPLENVDTDQLIPARFMSRPRTLGHGDFLLHDLRSGEDVARKDGIALDDPRYAGARILVARRNFGPGSSREAAVYALWDYGIRCVVAPSFGDIFASNAVKNGLLPVQIGDADTEALLAALAGAGGGPRLTVDLEAQTIAGLGLAVPFMVYPVCRQQLLQGWDDIDLTLQHRDAIAAFRAQRLAVAPWVMVAGADPEPKCPPDR